MALFHILGEAEWERAKAAGTYAPASLASEGFIHLSTARQLLRTAARFFAGRHDLVVLSIDEARTCAPVRFEPADGDSFPHLYGPLEVDAVTEVAPLPLVGGRFTVPDAWKNIEKDFVSTG